MAYDPLNPSGMFGIRGMPRDILGTLGDAFLVQSGNDRIYAPRVQAEREAQALSDFGNDPVGSLQKYRQLNPVEGGKAWDTYMDNEREDQKFRADQTDKERKNAREQGEYENEAMGVAASMMQNASPETWPYLKPRVEAFLEARGVTLPFDIPETFDANFHSMFRGAPVPVKDQVSEANDKYYSDERLEDYDQDRTSRETVASLNRDAATGRTAMAQAGATERTAMSQAGAMDRTEFVQGRIDRRAASGGSSGGGSNRPPRPPRNANERVKGPDGRVWKAKKVGNSYTWE